MKMIRFILFVIITYSLSQYAWAQTSPLKVDHIISFNTSEGTDMNVDISPDGKTIVFDLLGDLYTIPEAGGKATQLTKGLAMNLRPIWSPDGNKLAYFSDATGQLALTLWDLKSNYRRNISLKEGLWRDLATVNPIWLPGSQYISYGFNDNYRRLYGVLAGEKELKGPLRHPISFSKDDSVAFYQDSDSLWSYNYILKTKNLIEARVDSITSNDYTVSPNGRWWVYLKDTLGFKCLKVKDVQHNSTRTLVSNLFNLKTTHFDISNPHFSISKDSRRLYIAYKGKIHKIDIESGKDDTIHFLANVQVAVAKHDYQQFHISDEPFQLHYLRFAIKSPDGKQIAFNALGAIYVKDLPVGQPSLLIKQAVRQYEPVYSPDGNWIAYSSWSDISGGQVWKIRKSGGKPVLLCSSSHPYLRIAWTPDGKHIGIVRLEPDRQTSKLVMISVNGGHETIIQDNIRSNSAISFMRGNSKQITYVPQITDWGDIPTLAMVNSSEGSDHNLAEGIIPERTDDMALSPDKKYLLYTFAENICVIPYTEYLGEKNSTISDGGMSICFAKGVDARWESDNNISWLYGNQYCETTIEHILAASEKGKISNDIQGIRKMNFIYAPLKPDYCDTLELRARRNYARGTIALIHARAITMEKSEVIDDACILIENGRFVSINSFGSVVIPKKAKIIDLSGKTIMPGLIDLHLHFNLENYILSPSQGLLRQQPWQYLTDLAYGITTARDPATGFDSYGYAELINSGAILGPREFSVGKPSLLYIGLITLDSLEQAICYVQERKLYGSNYIKQYGLPTRVQRQWLTMAADEAGLNITNEGEQDPIGNLSMIKDGNTGFEHFYKWGDVYDDIIKLIVKSQIVITPTLQGPLDDEHYFLYKYWRRPNAKSARFMDSAAYNRVLKIEPYDTIHPDLLNNDKLAARIYKAGGKIGMGSHGNDQGIGAHDEIWALQYGGLSNMEALQIATIDGANALGLQNDIGSITVGKIADLIILNSNPLEDIHNTRDIKYIMKEGVLYNGDTMDELWPEFKKCTEWRLIKTFKPIGTSKIN